MKAKGARDIQIRPCQHFREECDRRRERRQGIRNGLADKNIVCPVAGIWKPA